VNLPWKKCVQDLSSGTFAHEKIRSNAPAKRYPLIRRRFEEYGFPLHIDDRILPEDKSTLFVCSGMQRVRHMFSSPDGSVYGSLQSCIRTNDPGLVGDGTHLTSFGMLGNFSFNGPEYHVSCELWARILRDLKVPTNPEENFWQPGLFVLISRGDQVGTGASSIRVMFRCHREGIR
jgi:tRNA synthetases class II (A)